jgi:hypothetical protein
MRVKHMPSFMPIAEVESYRVVPPQKFTPRMANGIMSNVECVMNYSRKRGTDALVAEIQGGTMAPQLRAAKI